MIKKTSVLLLISMILFFTNVSCACAQMVMYNTKTGKIHSLNCKWAKKCTVNCVKIDKKEVLKRGGVPCKVCGSI